MRKNMSEPKTIEQKIATLPAWAREHVRTLERERNAAVQALRDYLNKQTPSEIFTEEMHQHSVGELLPGGLLQRGYVQDHRVIIEAHGVRLDVLTHYGDTNENSIVLQWDVPERTTSDVAFIPISFQRARLIAKEKMK